MDMPLGFVAQVDTGLVVVKSPPKPCTITITQINKVFAPSKPTNGPLHIPSRCEMANGVAAREKDRAQGTKSAPSLYANPMPLASENWTAGLPRTDHVEFFKATNWAATALGPLEDWNLALRLHTHTMFADSRSACLYWYVWYICEDRELIAAGVNRRRLFITNNLRFCR